MKLKKNMPFTVAPNALIQDETISPQARFLYVYMASMPDNWEFYMKPLARKMQMHTDTLRKYFAELQGNGWITNHGQKMEGTKFSANSYTINAEPESENFRVGKSPCRKNSESENFRVGKIPTLIKETSITKETIEEKKEEEAHHQSPDFSEMKSQIQKHLSKAIKRKDWLEMVEGLEVAVPEIIETISSAWIGLDRPFNPANRSHLKGVVTFAKNWCENEPRKRKVTEDEGEMIINETTLGNTPDAIYEIVEETLRRPIAMGYKEHYRPVVRKMLKEGVMDVQSFREIYPELIQHNYYAKQPQQLFEKYERLVGYMNADKNKGVWPN